MFFIAAALAIAIAEPSDVAQAETTDQQAAVQQDKQRTPEEQNKTPEPAPAGSNAPVEEKKPETPPHTGIHALFSGLVDDIKHLPSKPNAYLALGGGAVALAVHPIDQNVNAHLRTNYTLVNDIYKPAKYYGDTPEQAGLSIGTYVFGRLFDRPKASHLGMDLLRAQLITEILVEPIKLATRRERPDGSNHQSFPSGHAAVTFAGATVLERHLGWKRSALAYLIAGYVASSRLHDNRHYLSDVAFGAAVGTIAGRTVTQHGPNYWSFAPAGAPGGGVSVLASRRW